jgi:hypothetical protein
VPKTVIDHTQEKAERLADRADYLERLLAGLGTPSLAGGAAALVAAPAKPAPAVTGAGRPHIARPSGP